MEKRRLQLVLLVAALSLTGNVSAAGASDPQMSGQISRQTPMPKAAAALPPASAGGAAGELLQTGNVSERTPLPMAAGSQLTLKDAISIALKNHPRVAQAAAEYGAAEEQVGEARSYLGPQVSSVTEYLRSTDNGIGNTSYYNVYGTLPRLTGTNHNLAADDTSQTFSSSNDYAQGISVSQYLVDFGRRRGLVSERQFEAASSREQQYLVYLDLIAEVSQRYFDVLKAGQLIRVFEKAVEERQLHLHEAQVKAQAGLRPALDIYVTQAEVERAQLHLVDARSSQADAIAAFDNSLGLGGRSPNYQLADVLSYSKITDTMESLLAAAFHQRPDFRALRDEAQAMGAQVTQYRSDYFPTVNAVGGYFVLGTGTPASNNFNAGLVITWPVFNSFLTTHEVDEARFRQRAIQAEMEDLRQRIMLQVKTTFLDWQTSLQRINRAERALAASRAQLELAEKRYEAGLADIVELEDAQRNYTGDDAAYADALYGFSVTRAQVDQATGRSLAGL